MSTVSTTSQVVKVVRDPRRPRPKPARFVRVLESRQGKAVRLLITVGKQVDHYQVREISQDFGPDCRAFELTKEAPDAQPYAVLVNGSQSSCECLGYLRWSGSPQWSEGHRECKHLGAVRALMSQHKL
jgi:hypothetical protein